MRKTAAYVLAVIMTVITFAYTEASAMDLGRGTASITIVGNEQQTLLGKRFHVYQLFHVENSEGQESVSYTMNVPYEAALKKVVGKHLGKAASKVTEYEVMDYIGSLSANQVEGAKNGQELEGVYSGFRYFVEELRDEIAAQGVRGDVVTAASVTADNTFIISGLEYGYYIVDEVSDVEGTHAAASLCMVNTLNPDVRMNVKSDYPSVMKKIQEDDKRETVGENGWNDMADFEIGQTVPYKFVSDAPNMNGYDTYYYAWHDSMDEALTFRPGTVSISIRSENENKAYTLKETEFTVNTNPGNGETFKIEVSDLKKIIDREFNHRNHLGENRYGQEVVLRYDALLNDKAADDTGRPGFENDVKLEFSNNPDGNGKGQTGETPWDTVVCFTYKLQGLKTNNHDLQLEGARFRLYSDETCENEVYVKKTDKGYNVINRDCIGGNDHTGGKPPLDAVEIVSAEEGIFTVFGLDGGTYWLKETEAPAGYRPILEPIRIEVIPTFVTNRDSYVKGQGVANQALVSLEMAVRIRQFQDGIFNENSIALETDIEDGSGNLTVVNTVGKKLPIAGSSMILLMLGTGTGMMVYAAVRKRREELHEK